MEISFLLSMLKVQKTKDGDVNRIVIKKGELKKLGWIIVEE
jgi:hypothetical protein